MDALDSMDTSGRALVALLLTLVLLAVAVLVWRRRGPASGLSWLGVALLPVAAWLTGTLRLVTDVAGDVSRYVSRLVLSPTVWAGVVVLGVAVLLIVIGSALRRRGVGVRRGAAQVGQRAPRRTGDARPTAATADSGVDDDVEAILRRRGIS